MRPLLSGWRLRAAGLGVVVAVALAALALRPPWPGAVTG
jgi:hypothetical protein